MKKRKNKNIYKKIIYTAALLFIVRILTNIPVMGINKEVINSLKLDSEVYNLFNLFSGGGLSKFSMFALSISPYISASIIVQLLTIISPRLEEIQRDGEIGRKRIEKLTTIIAVILAIFTSFALTNQFVSMGVINDTTLIKITTMLSMIAGTGILIWIGKLITDNGIGNGVSLILTLNILSQIPKDIMIIFNKFVLNSSNIISRTIIVSLIMLIIVMFTIKINDTYHEVKLVYSGRLKGKRFIDGETSSLPIKLNPGSVTPVIFATTIMAVPIMVVDYLKLDGKKAVFLKEMLQTDNWFNPNNLKLSAGVIVYALLIIGFSYMYAEMVLNTYEISNTLKNQNATIPNVRQGHETIRYLSEIIKKTTFIGAISLLIMCLIPIALTSFIGVPIKFGGTSLIIVISVLTELANEIKIEIKSSKFKSFTGEILK